MANQEQLDILKQGMKVWNQWREEHPDIRPDLTNADLNGANLNGANLYDADLFEVDLTNASLFEANLINANLFNAHLNKADLRETHLREANLCGADLREANLNKANLNGANLFDARLNKASLREAYLGNASLSNANLREADLTGASLVDARLFNAHLNKADLSGAHLGDADLSNADLTGVVLREADLHGADLSRVVLREADLSGADLGEATLVETNFVEATLTNCRIYGISAWNVQLEGAKQDSLVITRENEPTITVDNLEVAQFIYLLLNHEKLRDVFNAVTERGVLLLGRFSEGGLEVLQAIAAKLREESYLPIIFDFERPQDRNYTETIKTLTGLARFVIADLSGPSVPQELYATIPHFKIPFVPIIEANRKPFAMSLDLLEYPWVVRPPVTFATTEELLEQLPAKVITPAEEKHQARQKLLEELFNKA